MLFYDHILLLIYDIDIEFHLSVNFKLKLVFPIDFDASIVLKEFLAFLPGLCDHQHRKMRAEKMHNPSHK